MMKRFHPERGLSLRKYFHLQGSLVSIFISCFLWGESPQSLSVSQEASAVPGAEIQPYRRVEADPCLNSHHVPPSEPCDPAVLPQVCFVKHSGIVNVLRSATPGRAKNAGREKWAKHFGEFRRRQLHYAGDACCVTCQLASISLLAPAQHVCPNGASLDYCHDDFLSVWKARLSSDKCGDGIHDVNDAESWWTPASNPYYSMVIGVGKTSVIWNQKWTREGWGFQNSFLLSPAARK